MDIKEMISGLTQKITGDGDLLEKFKADPVGTVKGLVGDKLTPEQLTSIAEAVKGKINLDKASDLLGGAGEMLGGLFGKK